MRAFYGGDTESARSFLRDDVRFTGPAASFTSADDYLSTSAHVASMVRKLEIQRIFVDDGDVCVFSTLETQALGEPILVADWYHLHGDRIGSIQTIFDTAPFATRSVEPSREAAVDPVCHMQVSTGSFTRTWSDVTYVFCSEGCARAFETNPGRYVAPH